MIINISILQEAWWDSDDMQHDSLQIKMIDCEGHHWHCGNLFYLREENPRREKWDWILCRNQGVNDHAGVLVTSSSREMLVRDEP
jgi:hypothetical protein